MFAELQETIKQLTSEEHLIQKDRQAQLANLAKAISNLLRKAVPVNLTFICTHNSRRSHLAQIWAQTAAAYFGIEKVETYSGGTEVTAFNESAVAALTALGFQIEKGATLANPRYAIRFDINAPTMTAFSKIYQSEVNPRADFIAVMTCTSADQGCPVVFGASRRISLPYEDPKIADGTAQEAQVYKQRARQIGREMLCTFAQVAASVKMARG